jgi:hypothetical protein
VQARYEVCAFAQEERLLQCGEEYRTAVGRQECMQDAVDLIIGHRTHWCTRAAITRLEECDEWAVRVCLCADREEVRVRAQECMQADAARCDDVAEMMIAHRLIK